MCSRIPPRRPRLTPGRANGGPARPGNFKWKDILIDYDWDNYEEHIEWVAAGDRDDDATKGTPLVPTWDEATEITIKQSTTKGDARMSTGSQKVTQKAFVEMATEALGHWDFEAASEPYRSSKPGLENLIANPLTDQQLADIEETDPLIEKGNFDWDWLSEMSVAASGG